MKLYSEQNLEELLWILLAPAALFRKISTAYGQSSWVNTANISYLTGSTIYWVLLVWFQGVSAQALLVANAAMFLVFYHTIGFYEALSSNDEREESAHNIGMYLLHGLAVVGVTILSLKVGAEVVCRVSGLVTGGADACETPRMQVFWPALAAYCVLLAYLQIKGFFRRPLIRTDHPISKHMMVLSRSDFGNLVYLLIVLALGLYL